MIYGHDDWHTPPEVFDLLGNPTFDLDPCGPTSGISFVPAATSHALPTDGLRAPWSGFVWLNPPFSETESWVTRMLAHVAAGGEGLVLTFNRTGSSWGQKLISSSNSVLFLRRRVRFRRPDGKARSTYLADNMICAFGKRAISCVDLAERNGHGVVVIPRGDGL